MAETLADQLGPLVKARDEALPPAPTYTWDFKTRSLWRNFLSVLNAKVGPLPPGVLQNAPNDGTVPLDQQLWSLLLMARQVAVEALGVAPQQVPVPTSGAEVASLLSTLTRTLSTSPSAKLSSWLDTEL